MGNSRRRGLYFSGEFHKTWVWLDPYSYLQATIEISQADQGAFPGCNKNLWKFQLPSLFPQHHHSTRDGGEPWAPRLIACACWSGSPIPEYSDCRRVAFHCNSPSLGQHIFKENILGRMVKWEFTERQRNYLMGIQLSYLLKDIVVTLASFLSRCSVQATARGRRHLSHWIFMVLCESGVIVLIL